MSDTALPTNRDPDSIRSIFDRIALTYDRTNLILSFGFHLYWNRRLTREILKRSPSRILDLCSGTGAIALELLKQNSHFHMHITCVDFCPAMLSLATHKLAPWTKRGHRISYIVADIQSLPVLEQQFDAVTMAYGIRNVPSPEAALKEIWRALRPGGRIGILELTRPKSKILRWCHRQYLRLAVPFLGKSLSQQQGAYEYLSQSIQDFQEPSALVESLQSSGFENIKAIPLTLGAATLFIAQKRQSFSTTPIL